jgi:hypothetical protein
VVLAVLLAGCATPELGVAIGDASLDCTELPAPAAGDAGPGDGGPAVDSPVAIISVDGLRADAVSAAPADTLIGLACRGAYSVSAQTVMPSLTLPAHASMVSGYLPAEHGLLHDYYQADQYIEVPTVFGLAVEAGLRAVIVVGKEKLVELAPPGTYSELQWVTGGDAAVVDAAIAAIPSGFDVLFVHLPDLDYAGHASGWMSADYLAQLRETDDEIARLVDALPAGTTVIVTADHGGHGTHHGTDAATDTTIPWIIAGPSVREGWAIGAPISIMDTAATAALVMGFALAPEASGCPVEEAFGE